MVKAFSLGMGFCLTIPEWRLACTLYYIFQDYGLMFREWRKLLEREWNEYTHFTVTSLAQVYNALCCIVCALRPVYKRNDG
jgi:hypothetical protein